MSDIMSRFNSHLAISAADPISLLKRAIPQSTDLRVIEILPRLKDGGCFVKFSHPDTIRCEEVEGVSAASWSDRI